MQQQFFIFILVGGLNTLFGYSLYALFIFFGLPYSFAVLLSTLFGITFNFFTTGRLVFNNTRQSRIFIFIAVYIFLYFFNVLLIKELQLIFNNLYYAGFIALFPSAIIAFLLNKFLVFRIAHETH